MINSPVLKRYYQTTSVEYAQSFLAFTTFMSCGGAMWGSLCLIFSIPLASIVPYGYVILSGLNLWMWYRNRQFRTSRFIQVFMSISLPFIFQWALGGYHKTGMVMIWAALALVAQLTFYKLKASLPWLILFIALLFISIQFNDFFEAHGLISINDPSIQQLLLGINIGVVFIMTFFIAWFFIDNQRKALSTIASKNQELMAKGTELESANQKLQLNEEELRQNLEELSVIHEKVSETKVKLEESLVREWEAKEALKKAMSTALAKKNQQIMSSLNYAKRIQQLLMPNPEEVVEDFDDAFILLQPRDVVSGDFFWYEDVQTRDEAFQVFGVADCTGHGVPGALMSMIGLEQLTEIVNVEQIDTPSAILNRLHHGVVNILKQNTSNNKDGMDIAICKIDKDNGVVEYAGAKTPLIYIQDGALHTIKGNRQPIGKLRLSTHTNFTNHIIDVSQPTSFYLFSDGFQDQFGGPNNRKFMIKRFKDLLLRIHQYPMKEQEHILRETLADWMGDEKQTDDVLVAGFVVNTLAMQ
ncbi:MAG: PP2C family protein-serine/threonine phosphatase [Flammeovirgaceae bacterium]